MRHAARAHALLVAGPGTGKTFTLAAAAEQLVGDGVDPDLLSVMTLTRSMAVSLAERIPHGTASTIHSFALKLLNRMGESSGRRVADNWEQDELVRKDLQLGYRANFNENISLTDVDAFLDRMAQAFREDQQEPAQLTAQERQLLAVLDTQRELLRYRLIDELVWTVVRLLEQGAELTLAPRAALIDEYQDLTAGELRLLHLLAQNHQTRIIACGGDRQSIFGFRDADLLALHRFKDVYDLDEVDFLSRSRRCSENICLLAEAVAEELPPLPGLNRPELTPWEEGADPGLVRILSTPSPIAEARWVIEECRRLIEEEGIPSSSIMIVIANYRAQVLSKLQEAVAERDDLPFELYDPVAIDPIAALPATRLLGAGARLAVDQPDQLAWRTLVWATPGLGDVRLSELLSQGEADYSRNIAALGAHDVVVGRVLATGRGIQERFGGVERISTRALIDFIADSLGVQVSSDDIDLLVGRIGEESSTSEIVSTIFELSQKTQAPPEDRPSDIPVRTVFGAKGLESDTVFLVNAIPQSFTAGGGVADGLRRLYVGLTRAKHRLYVTAPRNLRYTALGHATGAGFGGVAPLIMTPATSVGFTVEAL